MENNDTALTEMTPEMARARAEAWLRDHPYGDQDENGIDLSILRRNLTLTPTERLIRAEKAAREIIEIRKSLKRAAT